MELEKEFEIYAAIIDIEKTLEDLEEAMTTDITTAVRSVSLGIDAVKKLADLAISSRNIELQEGILALREQLLEAKEALLGAKEEVLVYKEENSALKAEITNLKQKLSENKEEVKLQLKKGAYYKEDGDGPFCTGCYDSQGKMIRLSNPMPGFNSCPLCKNTFRPTLEK